MSKNKIFIKYQLLVIGAGGTGTYFLKEVSRMLAGNPSIMPHIYSLTIMDGDIVEEKNLARQCYQKEDIGRKKSNVMAEILNATFDLSWGSYPFYLTDSKTLEPILEEPKQNDFTYIPVIIGCVDNHSARLQCETFFSEHNNCIYFDAANEYDNGECVFSYKLKGNVIGPCRSHYFPQILKEDLRPVTEISCEELNSVSPQHILTNMASGMQLLVAFNNLLKGVIKPGISFFNPFTFSNEFVEFKNV